MGSFFSGDEGRDMMLLLVLVALVSASEFTEMVGAVNKEKAQIVEWLAPLLDKASSPRRVCLVQDDRLGSLGARLVGRGHTVTMAQFAAKVEVPPAGVSQLELSAPVETTGRFGSAFDQSVAAFETLRHQNFDVLVFASDAGLGYVCQEAKRAGVAFENTMIVVQAHGRPCHSEDEVPHFQVMVQRFIAQKSIELADAAFLLGEEETLDRLFFSEPVHVWRVADLDHAVSLVESQRVKPHSQLIMEPLVTAIVTSFNRPEMLQEAVASLKAQTYSQMEIVVVDDASTEAAMGPVLDKLAAVPDVTVIRNKDNRYLGAARNIGARKAKGQYLVFLDDDNIALPNMVSTL